MAAARHRRSWKFVLRVAATLPLLVAASAYASTYVVYIPLDSSIYSELETLNGLGYLDTYLDEIKPISRVEAARLVLEAQANLAESGRSDRLAQALLASLKKQLREEIGWLESNSEDRQPTIIHPLDRVEAQYIYSSGPRRYWRTGRNGAINAREQTPLLPDNDGLPTASGNNEIVRFLGWGGFGGFLTSYAEGAVSGPMTHALSGASRAQLLGAETVLSLGNVAISLGQQERRWGTGHFAPLSQSTNAQPFWALTIENIHPSYLPWIFRYLGPGRRQFFFGQLDAGRAFAQHPWILGHIVVFKPLPTFEFGLTRAIIFGGRNNDHYNLGGFLGRATGLATGNPNHGNTNSRGGVFLKFHFPSLRNIQVYQEILGEDNLTKEIPGIGRFIPFLAVSYQGGVYIPRLTADGLTDLRFEYALIEPNYSIHYQGLYWTNQGQFMGDPMGPNATEADLQVGRWFAYRYKLDADVFYTEEAPTFGTNTPYPFTFYPYPLTKERSFGMALSLFSLPAPAGTVSPWLAAVQGFVGEHAKIAVEYAQGLNYQSHANSLRLMLMLSGTIDNVLPSWNWR